MTVQIKNFSTDFARFVDEEIRHVVKVVTSTKIVECSGVILSQHSDVMKKMIERDDEIFLDNYTFAKECLMILHGGPVALTEENCQDIMKFAVQFGISGLVEQAMNFLDSKVDETNLLAFTKICWNVTKFASFWGTFIDVDYFWPCEQTIDKMDSSKAAEYIENFNSELGLNAVFDLIMNKIFARKLLPSVSKLIDQTNVTEVMEILQQSYADIEQTFATCPKDDVALVFEAIEKLSLSNRHSKLLLNLKKSIYREIESIGLSVQMPQNIDLKEVLKTWKGFDKEHMFYLCKFKNVHFYLLEVIMSWTALNAPDLITVKELCRSIDISAFTEDYIQHSVIVFESLGYDITFDISRCKQLDTGSQEHLPKEIKCISNNYSGSRKLSIAFACSNITYSISSYWSRSKTASTCSESLIEINSEGISFICYRSTEDTSPVNYNKERLLYGRTFDGNQVPFYTDIETALKLSYDPKSIKAFLVPETPA